MRHFFNCSAKTVFKRISTKPEEFRKTFVLFYSQQSPFLQLPQKSTWFLTYRAALTYLHKDQLEPSPQPFPLISWGTCLRHLSHSHPETAGQHQEPEETQRIPFQDITLQLSAATSARVQVRRLDTWCDTPGRERAARIWD